MQLLYKDSAHIADEELRELRERLAPYTELIQHVLKTGGYQEFESSINLPFDAELLEEVLRMRDALHTPLLKYVIVIGIGGSNLGTKALYDALHGAFDVFESDRFPKIVFLDTTSPTFLSHIEKFIDTHIASAEEVAVNVISKSGSTTESIANVEIVMNLLRGRFNNASERLVVTTDTDSPIWNSAKEQGIRTLPIPALVGGRFSVLSSVGLFPLSLVGYDIEGLRNGARYVLEDFVLRGSVEQNLSLTTAAILFNAKEKGRVINDNFFFNPELESIGKWYRQLMAESLGKEKSLDGSVVNTGITPIVSIGSVDLHSVAQLYFGGPKDKFTTFISAGETEGGMRMPDDRLFKMLAPELAERSPNEIMRAILDGVKTAYAKNDMPYMEVVLPGVSAHTLGMFLQFNMLSIMYLGKLLNVNAFDQPNVEAYKEETRAILQSQMQ